ncbi:unnamed protein product [Mytilus coruscus]|uniref:B box-type domain-containing protein n=1 Tax=Mytilus coruscus TaxID=42192 RepID=A0A6J8CVV6_MYTCO|nr:unnamed protein product [Mytilus coruscus]
MCYEHPDKYLEYFCINHEKTCCVLCKRQYHRDCHEIGKVNDVVDDTKLITTTMDLLSDIGERKTRLTKIADKEKLNLFELETTKDKCIEELTNTRIAINEYLDSLQNEVEKEINKKHEYDLRQTNQRVTDLTAKFKYINDHQTLVEDIEKQSGLSVGQKYLRIMRLKHMEGGCNESQETLPECNLHGMTNYSMSYEIAKDSITISFNRTLQERNTDKENFQEKEDEIESCSSIIELEPNESETASSTLSLPVPDSTSTSPVINAPKLPLTCPKTLPAELSHISPVTFSSPISVTQQSTQVHCAAASAEGYSSDYYLKNSFFIEKRNRKTCITDAKWMPNKYFIAIAEKSNPRCILYSKDGEKKGQVRLSGEPDSIAVITCENNNLKVLLLFLSKRVAL